MHITALTASIKINDIPIGHIYIRRLSPKTNEITDDTVCEYEWVVRVNNDTKVSSKPVTHRYSDGALMLIEKVIQEVSRMT
jgi:hypothetical protein